MGEVYRARDAKLDRDVAIKVLPERLASDTAALARFEREAKTVAALSHPNLLGIYDFGTHDGVVYAVTELLSGETLRDRLSAGPIPRRKAMEYALQIARGLAAAHEHGVAHRDLKPENVFVTNDGRVKILDFGLAKALLPASETSGAATFGATEPGTVLGTVGYMSPAPVRGKPRWLALAAGLAIALLVAGAFVAGRRVGARGKTAGIPTITFSQQTNQQGVEKFPALSPDGSSLAYVSRESGNDDIYLQRVGGHNPINLTKDSAEDDTQPAFSPDGSTIAFRSERGA